MEIMGGKQAGGQARSHVAEYGGDLNSRPRSAGFIPLHGDQRREISGDFERKRIQKLKQQ